MRVNLGSCFTLRILVRPIYFIWTPFRSTDAGHRLLPDIERTYGERKPLAARTPLTLSTVATPALTPVEPFATTPASEDRPDSLLNVEPQVMMTRLDLDNRYFGKDLLIFNNFDIFR